MKPLRFTPHLVFLIRPPPSPPPPFAAKARPLHPPSTPPLRAARSGSSTPPTTSLECAGSWRPYSQSLLTLLKRQQVPVRWCICFPEFFWRCTSCLTPTLCFLQPADLLGEEQLPARRCVALSRTVPTPNNNTAFSHWSSLAQVQEHRVPRPAAVCQATAAAAVLRPRRYERRSRVCRVCSVRVSRCISGA